MKFCTNCLRFEYINKQRYCRNCNLRLSFVRDYFIEFSEAYKCFIIKGSINKHRV